MSQVVAIAKVSDEILVYIDFDRPVWQNKLFKELNCIPSLDNFMCDGILGSLSSKNLSRAGIQVRFSQEDFAENPSSRELQMARGIIYESSEILIELFHEGQIDSFLAKDLSRFSGKIVINKINYEDFANLLK
jgi:hypothetical protein